MCVSFIVEFDSKKKIWSVFFSAYVYRAYHNYLGTTLLKSTFLVFGLGTTLLKSTFLVALHLL